MKKLGVVTIGQSPRPDILTDMIPYWRPSIQILETGALDGWEMEKISSLDRQPGDRLLATRLRNGTTVVLPEKHIHTELRRCVKQLEDADSDFVLFLCTGKMPDKLQSRVPMLFPQKILQGFVRAVFPQKRILILTPESEQMAHLHTEWNQYGLDAAVLPLSPFSPVTDPDARGEGSHSWSDVLSCITADPASVVVMDCMSYSNEMKLKIARETGKMVILARTLVGRVAGELFEL